MFTKVKKITLLGLQDTMDLEVDDPLHCYYASGLAVSNSHAAAYSALTANELYLKAHFALEFFTATLNCTMLQQKTRDKESKVASYIRYLRKSHKRVFPVSINKSKDLFSVEGEKDNEGIRFALSRVKSVGASASAIVAGQPYSSMADFLSRVNKADVNKGKLEALIFAGAFDEFYEGDLSKKRNEAFKEFYSIRGVKEEPPSMTERGWKDKEIEFTSVCLSEIPILDRREYMFEKNSEAKPISVMKKMTHGGLVFGEIVSLDETTTKAGKPMLRVTLDDGYDSMKILVFDRSGGIIRFCGMKKACRGWIGVIPVEKLPGDGDVFCFVPSRHEEMFRFGGEGGDDKVSSD